MEPDLKQNSFVSEQQFNHFIGQSSLAEYFQNFISRETIELGDVKCSREKFTDGPNTGYCTYPRFSSLSIEDHKMILEEYKNVVKGIDVEPGRMVAQGLKSQVLSEQQEFQHFVFLKARDNVEHYNYIHPEARQLLQENKACTRAQCYPQFYLLQKTIGVTVGAQFQTDPALEFVKNLLQVGRIPRIAPPEARIKLDQTRPTRKTQSSSRLSDDPNIIRMAKEHKVDIVTCSSAIETLIDNQTPDYREEWDIPIHVRDLQENSSKTVFIEKPFPGKQCTPLHLNAELYKRCLRQMLHVDANASSSAKTSSPDKESYALESRSSVTKTGSSVIGAEEPTTTEPNALDSKSLVTNTAPSVIGAKPDTTIESKNYVYSLWKIGKFNLLLRCSLDAYMQRDIGNDFLSLAVKPEYLPSYGHERFTASQTARMWTKVFLRPGTALLCARVDVDTSEIMRVDKLKLTEILSAGCGFNPGIGFKLLFGLMSTFSQLFEGSYLLSHAPGALHCCLYKGIDSRYGVSARKPDVDLHARGAKECSVRPFQGHDIPWAGIDCNLFLEEHIRQQRIPGTFPPAPARAPWESDQWDKRQHPMRASWESDQNFHGNWKVAGQGYQGKWKKKKKKKKKKKAGISYGHGFEKFQ